MATPVIRKVVEMGPSQPDQLPEPLQMLFSVVMLGQARLV